MTPQFGFAGETFTLLASGALWWPAAATLFVADLHLEKASHFAARGWLLPPHATAETLQLLISAVEHTSARRIVCLGDSFHDQDGPERLLPEARHALGLMTRNLDWWWITGNHDEDAAASLGGQVMETARIGPLVLRHEADPLDATPELSGHFHPKLVIRHRGRHITRRCVAAGPTKLILPAFGAFTGGLEVGDPAIRNALVGPACALVVEGERVLRFPI
ncbi:ligase-associated DNA damage response endonuclease PdeM [Sandarakinorhabdus sp.]|uniref:ligase-associated DNA damage response endonuclease PdeM n=1 Tax=Sandarakinorhabdus sp. TaxID=1916663 RepID=UPI003F6E7E6F